MELGFNPDLQYTPDGRFLAYRDEARFDGADYINFLDPVTLECRGAINSSMKHWRFSSDGRRVAGYECDEERRMLTVFTWNLVEGPEFTKLIAKHVVPGHCLAISPSLKVFAIAISSAESPNQETIELRDLVTGRKLQDTQYLALHQIQSLNFSPSGNYLISNASLPREQWNDWDYRMVTRHTIWIIENELQELGYMEHEPMFAGCEDRFVTYSEGGAEVWSVQTMERRFDLSGTHDCRFPIPSRVPIQSVVVSPDGRIAVASHLNSSGKRDALSQWISDHIIKQKTDSVGSFARVWSTETGREIALLPGCADWDFSPDGLLLITGPSDGMLTIWDMPPRPVLARVLGNSFALWLGIVAPPWLYRVWLRRRAASG
jgi:WD40 repeat protein